MKGVAIVYSLAVVAKTFATLSTAHSFRHAADLSRKAVDLDSVSALVDNFGDRMLQASPVRHAHLDKTVLGKAGKVKEPATEKGSCKRRTVAVFGASTRLGQLVIKKLIAEGFCVKAMLRDPDTAKSLGLLPAKVAAVKLDYPQASEEAIRAACRGADSAIWVASGFTASKKSIDVEGMKKIPKAFLSSRKAENPVPRIVFLSSAAVTRPTWDGKTKASLIGAVKVPIARLNPRGVLDRKREAEELLRRSGVPYCIVRPTGFKFEGWPAGRILLSQGDVAVGRTNPEDLVGVLVGVLEEPSATGKTFEMFTLQGYPVPRHFSWGSALKPLKRDDEGPLRLAEVRAKYEVMQQLLPGEEDEDVTKSYEQLGLGEIQTRRRSRDSKLDARVEQVRVSQLAGAKKLAFVDGGDY
eukprot:gnl/TRDRNA2_/TRDRNA2_161234_c0_seq2.p1 gnl/TRDRNA2_/TRDRNA2_161234_c0~~gnl/TRDRNA2_/TRDRNA2_161234_c0_seq2.p1  ORF type:complete len:411 (+),score=72.79 gnl/TRDRNA2_/TRDRNA2_161234_c0_seq2:51-1283(+)